MKTIKIAERGSGSQVHWTTKLMGVTWEVMFKMLQEMSNITWQSHTKTQIKR